MKKNTIEILRIINESPYARLDEDSSEARDIDKLASDGDLASVSDSVCLHPDKKRVVTGEILYCEECMKVLRTDC